MTSITNIDRSPYVPGPYGKGHECDLDVIYDDHEEDHVVKPVIIRIETPAKSQTEMVVIMLCWAVIGFVIATVFLQ